MIKIYNKGVFYNDNHESIADVREKVNKYLNEFIEENNLSRINIISIQESYTDIIFEIVMRYWENPNAKVESEQCFKETQEYCTILQNWIK